MIKNPVYRREMKVSARSIRMPLIMAIFNCILAAFALGSMAATVNQARINGRVDYAAFLDIFRYLAIIELALIVMVQPALTSGAISGERERQTLDLMLTTRLSPKDIVLGKLLSNLGEVVVVLISSLPILALIFTYGGVTVVDLVLVMVSFFMAALVSATIGILSSSICRSSTVSTAISYAGILIVFGGTLGLTIITYNLTGTAGESIYLLLINPAASFFVQIGAMTGDPQIIESFARSLNTAVSIDHVTWFILGIVIQLVFTVILLTFSIRNVGPHKKV